MIREARVPIRAADGGLGLRVYLVPGSEEGLSRCSCLSQQCWDLSIFRLFVVWELARCRQGCGVQGAHDHSRSCADAETHLHFTAHGYVTFACACCFRRACLTSVLLARLSGLNYG